MYYLSTKQHDRLQTVVTSFEIPYRTYIAKEIINKFPTFSDFEKDINSRVLNVNNKPDYQFISSELGKIKSKSNEIYSLLKNAEKTKSKVIIEEDTAVPNISVIVALTIIYKELFVEFLLNYKDEETYLSQALRYKYVRNKLDHRRSKTLEYSDMSITVDFISNALLFFNNDSSIFGEKTFEEILKEINVLQTLENNIPIKIHNIPSMPFPNMKIVCRDKEIAEIKEFIYGRPDALRKQTSLVIYGYGGVGKTALVLEAIKQIVKDIQDKTTINEYEPDFILFFSAKEEKLQFSKTTGKIENVKDKCAFKSFEELRNRIYESLEIKSFSGFLKNGIIIVDNLETLSESERTKVADFIRFDSAQGVQYIITSRNEENYDRRKKLAGFEDDISGENFVSSYLTENNSELLLSKEEIKTLLRISLGNTLVLVLCLRRLSLNIITMNGIISDMSIPTLKKLEKEMVQIPSNAFNIISQYMFKNSFQEIQENYKNKELILSAILKIFAVYPMRDIDLYTISMISKYSYSEIDPVLELLCKYLIIEKKGDYYHLNEFAETYIIQLFLPDLESYERIGNEIERSTYKIQAELKELQNNIDTNLTLKRIMQDWNVISDGDKISVAKAYKIYGEVTHDCQRNSKFFINAALEDSIKQIEALEANTMHPYIKFQKARILNCIHETDVLPENLLPKITKAYNETIWTIKTNPIYASIKQTKSYASVLWKYGIHLTDCNKNQEAVRYLEESQIIFEQIECKSDEYFQCLLLLGRGFISLYIEDKKSNLQYLRKARRISLLLYENKDFLKQRTKVASLNFKEELQKYGSF